jgi:hypothetical protein
MSHFLDLRRRKIYISGEIIQVTREGKAGIASLSPVVFPQRCSNLLSSTVFIWRNYTSDKRIGPAGSLK